MKMFLYAASMVLFVGCYVLGLVYHLKDGDIDRATMCYVLSLVNLLSAHHNRTIK